MPEKLDRIFRLVLRNLFLAWVEEELHKSPRCISSPLGACGNMETNMEKKKGGRTAPARRRRVIILLAADICYCEKSKCVLLSRV